MHIYAVLTCLYMHQLCAKLKKWQSIQYKVEYLGYIVNTGQVHMDPAKLEAIQNWPKPTTILYTL